MQKPDIHELLNVGIQMNASDLFIGEETEPSARIYGEVRKLKRDPFEKAEIDVFLADILSAKQKLQFEEYGDLDLGITLEQGQRFRLNLARQQGKVSIVARIVPTGNLELSDLALPEQLANLVEHKNGIVLVTGSTGSGKSTTLAALINHINKTKRAHIVTIEDPIEFVHTNQRARITQREVGTDTHSFHEALRRVVRQSPDVIMIGELRDQETIQVAMSAALTGHLVLATVHTIDASQSSRICQRLQFRDSIFQEYNEFRGIRQFELSVNKNNLCDVFVAIA